MTTSKIKNPLFKIHRGFTLVELLVVIAIIAILSVTAYVAMGGQTGKARNSRRQQDLGSMQNALEVYFVEHYSKYPDSLLDDDGLKDGDDLAPKYMPTIPTDPIPGNSYGYAVDGTHKFYQLATTMEQEDGSYKSYVIGNSDSDLITGVQAPGCTVGCTIVNDTTCVPYCP